MIRSLTIQISSTSGDETQAELEVVFSRWDDLGTASQRPEFQYAVRVPDGFAPESPDGRTIAYGHDLRLGAGAGIDHVKAMETLLTFLTSDGEKYRGGLNAAHYDGVPAATSEEALLKRTGDSYLFNEKTAELAYMLADELAYAEEELRASGADEPAKELALATEALDAVARELSGVSWNADTVERIAAIVGATGRTIKDVSDDDDHLPREVLGRWHGWELRRYPKGMAGSPEVQFDASQVDGVGLSPGCESLAELFEWLEQEVAEQREQDDERRTADEARSESEDLELHRIEQAMSHAQRSAAVVHGLHLAAPEFQTCTTHGDVVMVASRKFGQIDVGDTVLVDTSGEVHWINVGHKSCACESGVRERAQYGNVHTDDELGR